MKQKYLFRFNGCNYEVKNFNDEELEHYLAENIDREIEIQFLCNVDVDDTNSRGCISNKDECIVKKHNIFHLNFNGGDEYIDLSKIVSLSKVLEKKIYQDSFRFEFSFRLNKWRHTVDTPWIKKEWIEGTYRLSDENQALHNKNKIEITNFRNELIKNWKDGKE